LHKFGEAGDFVTAPELGSLFATCIAQQVNEITAKLGQYQILELGAGTGRLAADLLLSLPAENQPQRYFILERSADLRAVQQEVIATRLPNWKDQVEWLDQPLEESWDGVLLANEVLDALAVERFRLTVKGIEQVGVAQREQGFEWCYRDAPEYLKNAVSHLELNSASPYISEINTHLEGWLKSVVTGLRKGVALFIDYGYPRSEYYRPGRKDGTLMCHYRHRAHEDVFFWPGLQDITASVDFTALAESASACGMDVAGYTSQTMFLLGCGLDEILSGRSENFTDVGIQMNAEARQLTMPNTMGERFQVMALTRDWDEALRGFALRDLRHRL